MSGPLDKLSNWLELSKKQIVVRGLVVILIACSMVFMMVAITLNVSLLQWGIRARQARGLIGIISWPWLHSSWRHLLSNLPSLLLFSTLLLALYKPIFFFFFTWITAQILGGLLVWATSDPTYVVVGASGVVMGLFGALVVQFFFKRTWRNLVITGALLVFYGLSVAIAVLPGRTTEDGIYISWQAHLWGLLCGIGAGIAQGLYNRKKEQILQHSSPQQEPYLQNQLQFDEISNHSTRSQNLEDENPFNAPFDLQ